MALGIYLHKTQLWNQRFLVRRQVWGFLSRVALDGGTLEEFGHEGDSILRPCCHDSRVDDGGFPTCLSNNLTLFGYLVEDLSWSEIYWHLLDMSIIYDHVPTVCIYVDHIIKHRDGKKWKKDCRWCSCWAWGFTTGIVEMTLRPFPQLKEHPTWFPDFVNLLYSKTKRESSFWSHVRESHQVELPWNGPFIGWFVDSSWFHGFHWMSLPHLWYGHVGHVADAFPTSKLWPRTQRPEWWIALNIYRKPQKFAPSNQGNPNAIGLPSQTTSINSRDLSKCHLPKPVCRCKGYWSLLNIICHDLWFWMIRTYWNVSSRNCCYEPCKEPHYSKNVQTNYVLCWGIDTAMWHSYQPSKKETIGQ